MVQISELTNLNKTEHISIEMNHSLAPFSQLVLNRPINWMFIDKTSFFHHNFRFVQIPVFVVFANKVLLYFRWFWYQWTHEIPIHSRSTHAIWQRTSAPSERILLPELVLVPSQHLIDPFDLFVIGNLWPINVSSKQNSQHSWWCEINCVEFLIKRSRWNFCIKSNRSSVRIIQFKPIARVTVLVKSIEIIQK